MSNKKFDQLIKNSHNLEDAFAQLKAAPNRIDTALQKNYLQLLYHVANDDLQVFDFDPDVAHWLLLALRSSRSEVVFQFGCPFIVIDFKHKTPPGETKKSIIQCSGTATHYAVIPQIPAGYYNYYNGKIMKYVDYPDGFAWDTMQEIITDFYNFFPAKLDYIQQKGQKVVDFSLIGNTLTTRKNNGAKYNFRLADMHRAMHITSLGYNYTWEFSPVTQFLRMKYSRGFALIPQTTL